MVSQSCTNALVEFHKEILNATLIKGNSDVNYNCICNDFQIKSPLKFQLKAYFALDWMLIWSVCPGVAMDSIIEHHFY